MSASSYTLDVSFMARALLFLLAQQYIYDTSRHLLGLLLYQFRGVLAGKVLGINQDWGVGHAELNHLHAGELLEGLVNQSHRRYPLAHHIHRVTHGRRRARPSGADPDQGVVDLGCQLLHFWQSRRVPGALL